MTAPRLGEKELRPFPAGSFMFIPVGLAHFIATPAGPVIVQLNGQGVFGTTLVEH